MTFTFSNSNCRKLYTVGKIYFEILNVLPLISGENPLINDGDLNTEYRLVVQTN